MLVRNPNPEGSFRKWLSAWTRKFSWKFSKNGKDKHLSLPSSRPPPSPVSCRIIDFCWGTKKVVGYQTYYPGKLVRHSSPLFRSHPLLKTPSIENTHCPKNIDSASPPLKDKWCKITKSQLPGQHATERDVHQPLLILRSGGLESLWHNHTTRSTER